MIHCINGKSYQMHSVLFVVKMWKLLYTYCSPVNAYSQYGKNYIKDCTNMGIELREMSSQNVILGTLHETPQHITNFLNIFIKQQIYSYRCRGKTPQVRQVLAQVALQEQTEYYNAKIEGKLVKHIKKWAPLYPET